MPKEFTCLTCPDRPTCRKPCERIAEQLHRRCRAKASVHATDMTDLNMRADRFSEEEGKKRIGMF